MKRTAIRLFILFCLFGIKFQLIAQNDSSSVQQDSLPPEQKISIIEKNDGAQFIGIILSDDNREVLIRTKTIGDVYIPKHEIASIEDYDPAQFKKGLFVGEDLFATRYIFTTNGLPIKKGESYVLLNLYGPDVQFAVANNFSLGVITSWGMIPIIASAKKSFSLGKNTHMAVGGLAGWGGPWFEEIQRVGGALPFVSLTTGNRVNNFSINAGYLFLTYSDEQAVFDNNGNFLYSNVVQENFHSPMLGLGALVKLSQRTSFVFDSFVITNEIPALAGPSFILMPGMRFQSKERMYERAFAFNFNIVFLDGEINPPFPIPNVSWFIRL
jgi:hypothetical protein